MTRHQANDALLRRVLLANAAFSAISALACVFAAQAIAGALFATEFSLLGLSPAEIIFELGIGLLVFATVVALVATRAMLGGRWAKLVIAADLLWVLDSAVLLTVYPGHFSPIGFEIILAAAAIVGLFALGQSLGLVLLYQGKSDIRVARNGDRTTLTASLTTIASAERVWQVMSDQERYADVADNISQVEILEGRGEGMIRQCRDNDGKSWTETCTLWDEGRAFGFRVHTEAADYPYPIAGLAGTWSLAPAGAGTRITMTFDIQAKAGLVNRLLFRLMATPFAKICDRLLLKWVRIIEGGVKETVRRPATGQQAAQSA